MKYSAIIFDLDGVICHTDQYHYLAWKSVADELGIYFEEAINNRLRGVSRMESLDIILEKSAIKYSDKEKIDIAQRKNNRYVELLQNMTHSDLSGDVKSTLLKLRAKGLKLAIGSSSKNTPLILSRIGLNGFFDAISDGNNITRSKPDPQVFVMAAEMIGITPSECLVIEDAEAGLVAAHAGGMKSAAIGAAKDSSLADYRLNTFGDILSLVM